MLAMTSVMHPRMNMPKKLKIDSILTSLEHAHSRIHCHGHLSIYRTATSFVASVFYATPSRVTRGRADRPG